MKAGDTTPVLIAGQQVALATVKEVGEGTVTLVVPGTVVVMATRTEISTPPPAEPTGNQHILLDGVERTSGETSAPVGENQPNVENTPTETTQVNTTEDASVQEVSAPEGPVAPEAAPAGSDA